jgi:uroporphyrinogen-III synthase
MLRNFGRLRKGAQHRETPLIGALGEKRNLAPFLAHIEHLGDPPAETLPFGMAAVKRRESGIRPHREPARDNGGDAHLGRLVHDGAAVGNREAAGEAEILGRVLAVGKEKIIAQNAPVNERNLVFLLTNAAEVLAGMKRARPAGGDKRSDLIGGRIGKAAYCLDDAHALTPRPRQPGAPCLDGLQSPKPANSVANALDATRKEKGYTKFPGYRRGGETESAKNDLQGGARQGLRKDARPSERALGATDEGAILDTTARFARVNRDPNPSPPEQEIARLRVALFRERKDASATAARLRRLGFSAACLPAIEIEAKPVRPQRSHYDAVIATSDKAFHADGPLDTSAPLYAVGARTGRAAEARGWRLALPPAPDAEELIKALVSALKPEASVLYLAGRDRKGDIEAALTGVFALEVIGAYAAKARDAWRPREAAALGSCIAALHYSRRSASLAASLAKAAGAEASFLKLKHVCLSRDVAKPLQAIGATHVAIAETPNEAALFRTLRQALGGFASLESSRI